MWHWIIQCQERLIVKVRAQITGLWYTGVADAPVLVPVPHVVEVWFLHVVAPGDTSLIRRLARAFRVYGIGELIPEREMTESRTFLQVSRTTDCCVTHFVV